MEPIKLRKGDHLVVEVDGEVYRVCVAKAKVVAQIQYATPTRPDGQLERLPTILRLDLDLAVMGGPLTPAASGSSSPARPAP